MDAWDSGSGAQELGDSQCLDIYVHMLSRCPFAILRETSKTFLFLTASLVLLSAPQPVSPKINRHHGIFPSPGSFTSLLARVRLVQLCFKFSVLQASMIPTSTRL